MLRKCLIFIIAFESITKAAIHFENRCPHIIEKTKMTNGETLKYARTVLKCCDGYREPFENSNSFCEPICDPECPQFSRCTKPQQCELLCDEEMYRYDFEASRCVLKNCSCPSGVGFCIDDYNECSCHEGFRRTNDNVCVPVCQQQCQNAECVGPNQCECWLDYHVTAHPNICEPNDLCQLQLCENGECLLTGECKCKKGFTKSFTIKGQVVCETISVFIGKIMSLIIAIPLLLAFIVLLVVYLMARRRNAKDIFKHGGSKVIYATGNQVQQSVRRVRDYDNDAYM